MNFQPAIYEHAAKLINHSPWEVSRDFDLLVQAHSAAYELYHHNPISVGIDIYNVEAQAYHGYVKKPYGTTIPTIVPPYSGLDAVLKATFAGESVYSRLDMIRCAGVKLAERFPDAVVKIPVSGPFSLLSNLIKLENLLPQAVMNPKGLEKVLLHLVEGQIDLCRKLQEVRLEPIIFESGAVPPLISPKMFKEIELPAIQKLMVKADFLFWAPQALIVGGDSLPILDSLLECNPSYLICPFETDQKKFMQKMKNRLSVMVRINMDPQVFIGNDEQKAFEEADRVLELAGKRRNVCIGSGALPFEANPDMVLAVKEYLKPK